MSATYLKILEREVLPKLKSLGFVRVELKGCICPEVLLRKGDLWFGTSWDYRDQYLELNVGDLYWLKDVMPRVVVLGEYSDHYQALKRLPSSSPDYLEVVAAHVAGSIEEVVSATENIQASVARGKARLRPLLIAKVLDGELEKYVA